MDPAMVALLDVANPDDPVILPVMVPVPATEKLLDPVMAPVTDNALDMATLLANVNG